LFDANIQIKPKNGDSFSLFFNRRQRKKATHLSFQFKWLVFDGKRVEGITEEGEGLRIWRRGTFRNNYAFLFFLQQLEKNIEANATHK
jgi:hypothetical protein